MKKLIFYELAKYVKGNKRFGRRVKVFVAIGIAGFLVVGILVIVAGVAAFNVAGDLVRNSDVSKHMETVKEEINEMPALAAAGCWEKTKSLIDVGVWLETPIGENVQSWKQACLPPESNSGS